MLASGSRGNSAVVSSSRTRILVDAGLSCRELFKRMQQTGEDPCALDAILITHEHQDHVQGLSVAARKLGIPVYFTEATHRAWLRWMNPRKRMSYADWLLARQKEAAERKAALNAPVVPSPVGPAPVITPPLGPAPQQAEAIGSVPAHILGDDPFYREQELAECAEEEAELACGGDPLNDPQQREASQPAADPSALPAIEYFRAGAGFSIGDAADPVGFVFKAEGIRVGLATDLGYMPANVSQHLRGCDIVMLESNHDLDMLRDGPYPWSVKQRVLSRVGHLSNAAAADFLEKAYDGQAAYVVLAHLSESNNMPELARVAAEFALRNRMSLLANKLVLASQHEPSEPLSL